MPCTSAFDHLGREILPNDLLLYPVRRGSEMRLKRISVTKVEPKLVWGLSPDGHPVKLTNLENTIVVRPGQTTPPILR